jgi:chromosomal replication initiator protein
MEANHIWQAALDRVRRRISPGAFATWFSGTSGMELSGTCLTVATPSTFAAEHLRQRFSELARIAVSEIMGQSAEIAFVVRGMSQATPTAPSRRATSARRRATAVAQQVAIATEPHPAPTSARARGQRRTTPLLAQPPLVSPAEPATAESRQSRPVPGTAAPAAERVEHVLPPHDLHPRHVFETYVVGTSNRFAFAAAQEIAAAPGERYNPLFIYGGVGLGKTHLLHAIGQVAHARGLSVAYVTAEQFTNEIIEAIHRRTTAEFRLRYRAVDVLLVDDVQYIAGKESTEEEFFHTFNTLHEANRQIVLTSDRVPHDMARLHDRLRSRFGWGLMADIQPPGFEDRLAILRAKAATLPVAVPESVLAYLAEPECASVRALEAALNRVVAYAQVLRKPVDVQLAAVALAPLASQERPREVSGEYVLAAVAGHYHLRVEDLRGKSRSRSIAWARQVAMYLIREETPASLGQIGQMLGGRDHTTIMHGCARVSTALAGDGQTREDIAAIRAALRR